MPRQTPTTYLTQRTVLTKFWQLSPALFSLLSSSDQRTLHDYYRLTVELTDNEALNHRHQVTTRHPSLPHKAGKAFRRLTTRLQIQPQKPGPPSHHRKARSRATVGGGHLAVRTVLRPEPDYPLLGRMFTQLAKDLRKQQAPVPADAAQEKPVDQPPHTNQP